MKIKYLIKVISFILLLLYLNNSIAQEIVWQNTIGGSSIDWLQDVTVANDGGYIIVGYSDSDSSGDKIENHIGLLPGAPDFWIVKTDSVGNLQWQNTIGGDVNDSPYAVIQTNDGGYLVGGFSNSDISGDKSENNVCGGGFDYWVVKLNNVGIIQWQNTIGGALGQSYLTDIKQTFDGGYIIGGYSEANICGDKTENSLGGFDYWIVKLNNAGSIEWDNTIGGNQDDLLRSIDLTSDGGIILGGTSSSPISGDKTEDSMYDDYWIVKTDSNGNILWQNTIGGSNNDRLFSIQQIHNGGFILGGHSVSDISGDKNENCMGSFDYWILETDSVGNIGWQETIGGNSADQLSSVQQTNDHGFILGGASSSMISGDKTEDSWISAVDYWIIKVDSIGNIVWQNTIGGFEDEWLGIIKESSNGTYILAGTTGSVNANGDKTEVSPGFYNYWILKICTNSFNMMNFTVCDSMVSPSGIYTWYNTGIYNDTLTNLNGCDSIITINLTINAVDTSVTINGIILNANAPNATFQWLDCGSGNIIINGEIDQTFIPTLNGSYSVIVNQNGCIDTSGCFNITGVGIYEPDFKNIMSVFPNPTRGALFVEFKERISLIELKISNVFGQEVIKTFYHDAQNINMELELVNGIYFLEIKSNDHQSTHKIVKL